MNTVPHQGIRGGAPSRPWPVRLRPVLLAAACAVAAVTGVAVTTPSVRGGSPVTTAAASSSRVPSPPADQDRSYVGPLWRLETVLHGGKLVVVPSGVVATLELSPDGRITLSDSLNILGGRYTLTRGGFSTSEMAVSAVGYAGSDPSGMALVDGMAAVAGVAVDGVPGSVVATPADSRLVLETGGYRLTFGPSAAGPGRSSPTGSTALTSGCRAAQLQPGLLRLSGQTGEHGTVVTLLNHSATACTLVGHPGVELLDAAVLPFQIRYSTGHYVTAARPALVRLAPGSTAYVFVAKYRCDLGSDRTATSLRLTLPGDDAGVTVAVSGRFDHCTGQDRDVGNTVEVSPIGGRLADLGSIPK